MNTKVAGRMNHTRSLERSNRVQKKRLSEQGAFTLVDLMVTVALIGVIAVLIVPVMGRAGTSAPAAQCLNNLRQLGAAWAMYSSDSQGMLIESHPWMMGSTGRLPNTVNRYSWAPGYAGSGNITIYGAPPLHSSTNENGFKVSVFYKYYNSVSLLKCASDKRTVGGNPILRSYSMNNWMNGSVLGIGHQLFTKEEQVTRPAATWVTIDEDARTLDDSMFITFMDGRGYVNLPARRHNNGYSMNFADGRAEIYRLKDAVNISASAPPPSSGLPGSGSTADYRFHTNITTYSFWMEN